MKTRISPATRLIGTAGAREQRQPGGRTVADGTGNAVIAGMVTVAKATALNGGLAMDFNKFTVADAPGNIAIAGTLGVAGATTVTGAATLNGVIRCQWA